MKLSVKQIVTTGILLAICIASQLFKNVSPYITGPIVNTCLVICYLSCGLVCALIMAVISPVTAFFISGSPIMAAIPPIIPCIMVGNALLVLSLFFFHNRLLKGKLSLPLSMGIGCILKAGFMGLVIALILIPTAVPHLPEKLAQKAPVFQKTFSLTQLITAACGCVLAYIIWLPLKKVLSQES